MARDKIPRSLDSGVHAQPASKVRRTRRPTFAGQAGLFLASAWAGYLADLIGLEATAIRREARKLAESRRHQADRPAIAA